MNGNILLLALLSVMGGLHYTLAKQESEKNTTDMQLHEQHLGFYLNDTSKHKHHIPSSCFEAIQRKHRSGIYKILVPRYSDVPFYVVCEDQVHFGGWTIVQRRFNYAIDFNRTWTEYQRGFGDLRGDFFIGLDKLHALTMIGPKQELLILLSDQGTNWNYAHYASFAISSEGDNYKINELGAMVGTVPDSLRDAFDQSFTTLDRDNDNYNGGNCALYSSGGWWYKDCGSSLLNGVEKTNRWGGMGTIDVHIKRIQMLIRPQNEERERVF